MSFCPETALEKIDSLISEKHLLKHPFYRAWSKGELSLDCLKEYAKEYYHHVKAFPTYLSAAHSRITEKEVRKMLLQNLIEEEGGSPDHPDLWKNFIKALGVSEDEIASHTPSSSIQELIDAFREICQTKTAASAVAALYAYESQIPAISISKIEGLISYYGMKKEKDWEYFSVHIEADKEHSAQERALLLGLVNSSNEKEVESSVSRVLEALNHFLSSISERYSICSC